MIFDSFIGEKRPLTWVLQFWPVFMTSWFCALWATWLCKKVAIKLNIVDKPDALVKTHKEPVAYLGGIGILAGLTVGVFTGLFLMHSDANYTSIFLWLVGILAGAAIACLVGLVDDLIDIEPWQKIAGQLVASVTLVAVGIRPALIPIATYFNIPMSDTMEIILGIPIVIIFVLGATNSLNLLDGLDGLCGGVTAIITLAMLFLAVHLGTWETSFAGDPVRIVICLSLVGGVLGFLPFNRHPAKIFMGDAGSMLLGFCTAALMILFAEKTPRWWFASIVVFGLPILDTATALVRRKLNKKPLFVSDRGHIYDQMIDRGIPLKKTVAISYGLAAMYAVIGIIMSQIRTWYAVGIYVIVFTISGWVIWKKGFLRMEGLRGAIRKPEVTNENE